MKINIYNIVCILTYVTCLFIRKPDTREQKTFFLETQFVLMLILHV